MTPPLARSGVDRASQHRTDPRWLADAWQRCQVLVVDPTGRTLCTDSSLVFVAPADAPDADRLFLGLDVDGTPYFAVAGDLPERPGARAATLREVGAALSDRDAGLFVTAAALANWHAAHLYSPRTGDPTTSGDGGWLRVDPAGGQLFPRTDPAVIALVHDGVTGPEGRCLLGHNVSWAARSGGRRFFSTLAGFVEPGESAEAAVEREVREEVGVTVSRLRYLGSQAWPFPGSLMLGYTAYADPAQPVEPDPAEIAEARWFTRTQIAALLSDRPDPGGAPHGAPPPPTRLPDPLHPARSISDLALPGPASIANYLIRTWLMR